MVSFLTGKDDTASCSPFTSSAVHHLQGSPVLKDDHNGLLGWCNVWMWKSVRAGRGEDTCGVSPNFIFYDTVRSKGFDISQQNMQVNTTPSSHPPALQTFTFPTDTHNEIWRDPTHVLSSAKPSMSILVFSPTCGQTKQN
ncbi:hypothetical protein B7P43_G05658 [Cryptotermes secundus]|uniref:Uncharacterized protein n=1 Tax=Cryptotermes secundus TaxID=105785 RepID=A0A2J7RFM9_9NEOP|nr:uncharacterized protein LOC111861354 [Cryptotermes secundus]XP_023701611.1 uncharacterized protein LOC111861354 [Cryptotermes secundus]XP_023701612.1 uncharacterized protein LOC111861354 [Cryptotermes secundus]XP_023701613.1 uncharacterized protein LOC111861354 [Cryptotermes secundus]XP_023701614.1 uncharacterized protein LOC111861354 [Cryptotermes secundus]XP_023701615.1 uncharacterized protein LOC111861354 [Cryptotermes secundus]XP_023701616.1 uncharacterized protein LOC111861354 [Crypto